MTDKIVILSTACDEGEAARLARLLVEQRLAACVNLIPEVRSFYRWKGKVEAGAEWMLLIKSSRERFEAVRAAIESAHSYEVPEVIALPIVDGAPNYLTWIGESLGEP